jgi:thiol:disulfide interchange protein DsbD
MVSGFYRQKDIVKFFLPLFTLVFLSTAAMPQADLEEPFEWNATVAPEKVFPGEKATLKVTFTPEEGHYIYKDMTSFTIQESEGISAGQTEFPETTRIKDPFDGKQKDVYREQAEFNIPLQIAASASEGTREVMLTLRYQGCSPDVCFFPKKEDHWVTLTIAPGKAVGESQGQTAPGEQAGAASDIPAGEGTFGQALQRGIFWAFVFVFIGGVLTSLTPCVYPLIPVTISIFGAREAESRLKAFLLSFTYVLGIAVTYSVLGVAAAATGAVFGQLMANPWVVSAVALLFILFGLSMLGVFQVQLPPGLQKKISQTGGKGFAGAFTMGLFGGIVAAPCTGPALGAVLAYVAKTQNLMLGFWLLFTFALGLGMLFLVLGTFSGLLARVPKSGGWMEGIKSFFAVVLFAFALYFLKSAFPVLQSVLGFSAGHFIVAALIIVLGLALGGLHKSLHHPERKQRIMKGAGVVLLTLGLFILFGSLIAEPDKMDSPAWITDLETGLKMGQEQGKPVMVDFWAEWCLACKELDRYTYSDPRVLERLDSFVSVKVDFTQESEKTTALSGKYDIRGLPTVLFFDQKGELLEDKTLLGFVGPEEFLEHVRQL